MLASKPINIMRSFQTIHAQALVESDACFQREGVFEMGLQRARQKGRAGAAYRIQKAAEAERLLAVTYRRGPGSACLPRDETLQKAAHRPCHALICGPCRLIPAAHWFASTDSFELFFKSMRRKGRMQAPGLQVGIVTLHTGNEADFAIDDSPVPSWILCISQNRHFVAVLEAQLVGVARLEPASPC